MECEPPEPEEGNWKEPFEIIYTHGDTHGP